MSSDLPGRARPSLTPPAFASPLAQPALSQGAPIPSPTALPLEVPVAPRAGRVAPLWLFGVLVIVLVLLVSYFLSALGAASSIVGAILALVPLVGVVVAVRIIDRWEPEPTGLLVLAAAWGAIAAVGIALAVDFAITAVIGNDGSVLREAFSVVVQAPIVEELGKGVGVLLIFLVARRAFDGPVDGIVYGALVGAGFAFTENIQYFAISFIEGGVADASVTFFIRGILSPFAHVMFTAVTGFAVGLAARRGASNGSILGAWVLGMMGAIVLHAIWNGSAMFGDFFALYLVLQVPLFVLFVIGVIALRREEARLTRRRLGEYAEAGWFTVQEADMLATPAGRKAGLAWAKSLRGDRSDIMMGFIRDATALAAARQRSVTGRDPHSAAEEHALLARTAAARAALFAL
ncbi:PrsW family intramembrane metalloprotease [Microbacterium sp. C7(2022)]|uniref:PrsW family intramembrane metalloprotease n=1 Tax=Microbacterium sp. C7(2022) TaxID=2992759 RepID=UPI00237BA362|nr:PrsW family intramembrane metalloprotease [Microbacterium sp. C7(2022)]MDE0547167.1 PrsW family intramembrane metalloprotease [Microbacterium sp. C7(2022)]